MSFFTALPLANTKLNKKFNMWYLTSKTYRLSLVQPKYPIHYNFLPNIFYILSASTSTYFRMNIIKLPIFFPIIGRRRFVHYSGTFDGR